MSSENKSSEADKIKKLAEFKKQLESDISEAEKSLENLKILNEFVEKALLESGFKRVKLPKFKIVESQVSSPPSPEEDVIALKADSGELLAHLHINGDSLQVVPIDALSFNKNTPPFEQFLIERVLEKMREKDVEAIEKGELAPNSAFSYELILDGEKIHEIQIKHLTSDRVRELKSSIRWTLEKMYEKMKRS